MQVIPVIDVRNGCAVQAIGGDRANYRLLASPLTASPDPLDVASGFMTLHAFPVIYIADLDGIEGRGANRHLPDLIGTANPSAEIWLDRGATPLDLRSSDTPTQITDVLGTESGWDCDALAALPFTRRKSRVLSLDFRRERFVGDNNVLVRPDLWPDRVIVMALDHVGGRGGPDIALLTQIISVASEAPYPIAIYAAGGVRNSADLKALADLDAAGALVATALHAQTITAADLC